MIFYSDAQNRSVVKNGVEIAKFCKGEFETFDANTIEQLKLNGYKYLEDAEVKEVQKVVEVKPKGRPKRGLK
jgi:hypothetical protein